MIGDKRITLEDIGVEARFQEALARGLDFCVEHNENLGELKVKMIIPIEVTFRRAERERGQKVGDVVGPDVIVKDVKLTLPERQGTKFCARLDGTSIVLDPEEDADGVRRLPFGTLRSVGDEE